MRRLLFTALIFMSCFCVNAQQAWTRAKGSSFSQAGITLYRYTSLLKTYDELVPFNRQFVQNSLQGYVEYGLTDKLMVTAIIPFTLAKSTTTAPGASTAVTDGSLSAFSNIQLGLTYNLYRNGGFVVSGKLNTALPTATYQEKTGLRSGEDALSVEPTALVGFSTARFFTSAELGIGFRTNNYSSQTLGAFQIGKHLGRKQKLLLIFNTNIRLSNKNGSYDDKKSNFTAMYLNNLSYLAPGIKVGYHLTPTLMGWANFRAALPPTQNIGASVQLTPGLSFALSYTPK